MFNCNFKCAASHSPLSNHLIQTTTNVINVGCWFAWGCWKHTFKRKWHPSDVATHFFVAVTATPNLRKLVANVNSAERWAALNTGCTGWVQPGMQHVFQTDFWGTMWGKWRSRAWGTKPSKQEGWWFEGLAAQRTEESSCFSTDRASNNKQTWPCLDVVWWLKPTAGGWSNPSRTFCPVCPLNPWPLTVHWHTFLTTSRGNSAEPPVDTNSRAAATLFAF